MTILSTPKAAIELSCSTYFLKRKRDIYGGFLKEGKHYFYSGKSSNAVINWDVELVRDELHYQGMKARGYVNEDGSLKKFPIKEKNNA